MQHKKHFLSLSMVFLCLPFSILRSWEIILSLVNVEISLFDNSLTNKKVLLSSWILYFQKLMKEFFSVYTECNNLFLEKGVLIIPEMRKVNNIMQKCLKCNCEPRSTLPAGLVGWLVGFVALHPKSTAMVIAGWSVHLTTLFPGQA